MSIADDTRRNERALLAELENQSDRGAAIVGVAWVEVELEGAITSFLRDSKRSRLRLFGRNGPVSTLSAKIDLACLLGICSEVITSDLHILRDIRNEFAHTLVGKDSTAPTFESLHIKDKCLALQCVAHEHIVKPRLAFVRACVTLNTELFVHSLVGYSISSDGRIVAKVEAGAV